MKELVIRDWKMLESPENLTGAWLTGEELGRHLGYSDPKDSVRRIYGRHQESFKDQIDTTTVKLTVVGKQRDVRIYSERGALKIIRYSNTPKADEIMDEVFDVFLEVKKQQRQFPVAKAAPDHPLMVSLHHLIEVTEKYVVMEQEQQRLKDEQERQAKRMDEFDAKATAFLGKTGYYSILAYAKVTGQPVTSGRAQRFGKKAAKTSKQKGYPIGKVRDERWGHVNTYHEDILREVFMELPS